VARRHVAQRILPALRSLHVLRAAVNVNIDGAPLGPIIGQLTADMIRTGTVGRALAPFLVTRFDSTVL
jgi:hypothetical protein